MSTPLSAAELKPCPFCGGEAEIERLGNARVSTIYRCTQCSCSLETGEEFNHGADWNRRSATPAEGLAAEFERLAEKATPKDGTDAYDRHLAWNQFATWCLEHRTDILRALKGDPQR